jgi:hypothetical protein
MSATLALGNGGGDAEMAAVPASTSRTGPWMAAADEGGPVVSADTLVICFNFYFVKGCYSRTTP